ncbi:hypothetical protein PR048_010812 [Dryococelus australis]|uniref:Uncharacterized protein n=1 Tax=Dryococelus australis TaxID=614101 RepID=A0ABQ9I3R5_9NEOP|nr:hypothetical protein PR048_010812 [Dryococelus australis]
MEDAAAKEEARLLLEKGYVDFDGSLLMELDVNDHIETIRCAFWGGEKQSICFLYACIGKKKEESDIRKHNESLLHLFSGKHKKLNSKRPSLLHKLENVFKCHGIYAQLEISADW